MNHNELAYLSAVDLAAKIRAKELSPVEVTKAVLERIDELNPKLSAFCISTAGQAVEAARGAEDAILRGQEVGPLHGVPVSIKDIVCMQGVRHTCGSKLLENNVAAEDAPAVERLRKAGAILIGRTNTPEFGFKGVTDNRVFGVTRNPWDPDLTPGGSSGGAAAAVAAGMGPIGIGTDGGGSIRIPAGFCGLVGFKPSFGRVPNYPATTVDSLRHTGPLTRTVADAALAFNVLAGPDERDPNSLLAAEADYLAAIDRGVKGLRIAYSGELGYASVQDDVAAVCQRAAQRFAGAGAKLEIVELDWRDPFDCWNVFFYGGIAGLLHDKLPDQGHLLDPGLRTIVEAGIKLRAVDYATALLARNAFWQDVRRTFEQFDLLITPTLAVPPFPVGQDNADPLPGQGSRALRWTPFTYPFNLTGQPAISVPCGWTGGRLPVGLQIVGRRFDDATVLRAARTLEQIQPWAGRTPRLTGDADQG